MMEVVEMGKIEKLEKRNVEVEMIGKRWGKPKGWD